MINPYSKSNPFGIFNFFEIRRFTKMTFFSTEQQFYFKMEFQKLKLKYIATFIV